MSEENEILDVSARKAINDVIVNQKALDEKLDKIETKLNEPAPAPVVNNIAPPAPVAPAPAPAASVAPPATPPDPVAPTPTTPAPKSSTK